MKPFKFTKAHNEIPVDKVATFKADFAAGPEEEVTVTTEDEWIWVEGYKGTDKDMKCKDYQYEFGVQHDMPEGEEVQICYKGFHLCLNLRDVFKFYDVGNGNRFFKVKALVKKIDYEMYDNNISAIFYVFSEPKLVAKSIIFESEVEAKDIVTNATGEDLPEKYYPLAIKHNISYALQQYRVDFLVEECGYSQPFATFLAAKDKSKYFNAARAIAQEDIPMDMKVTFILLNS
jgi:hypothetical protein